MILLLDLGNTRLKAGAADGKAVRRLASLPLSALAEPAGDSLAGIESGGPWTRVVAASVAGHEADARLEQALIARGLPPPEFVRVTPRAGGVVCAYPSPQRMGVDRWVALVGARALESGPSVVVDAGSAITVDAMDERGRHLGGLIAPGLGMMRASLLEGTGNLRVFSEASGPSRGALFPADTGPAIAEGVEQAATGLVEGAVARATTFLGARPSVFLTGGDAEVLDRGLAVPVRVEADLALEGLARLAAGRGSR